ncbi:hypothetical protein [Actinomyces viscosus]|uniref:hypothetical protein n=1 Tax=Actinomyces viscosus TaxID=1656 RepID=UPI001E48454A|nr:hypothetical protein [Actinomyces viscosus]
MRQRDHRRARRRRGPSTPASAPAYQRPSAGATTAVFSQLMALARYTNVGSHGAYGMGVIDVVADAP